MKLRRSVRQRERRHPLRQKHGQAFISGRTPTSTIELLTLYRDPSIVASKMEGKVAVFCTPDGRVIAKKEPPGTMTRRRMGMRVMAVKRPNMQSYEQCHLCTVRFVSKMGLKRHVEESHYSNKRKRSNTEVDAQVADGRFGDGSEEPP